MMADTGRFPLLTSPALETVEQALGVLFPSDYRSFLLAENGCVPEVCRYFHVADRGDVMLGALYGVGSTRAGLDLEYQQEQATRWNPLPRGNVAIGEDPGGNLLLLSTAGDDAGCVYFWDRVGLWVREDGQNLFLVAPSFATFWESLRTE